MDALTQSLHDFANQECRDEPLYRAICLIAAHDPDLMALLRLAPPEQRRANLLLAALHERVLAGAGGAMAEYFGSVGGARPPDPQLPAALADLVRREADALAQHLRSRSTQTNEIGRCAVLWPALSAVSEITGASDLALLDFGCSAGLNLGVDGYHYRYQDDAGGFSLGAVVEGEPAHVECDWQGPRPPSIPWRLVARTGLDPAPLRLSDPTQFLWLRACLWPSDAARDRRLQRAAEKARAADWPVHKAIDCIQAIAPWLDSLPPGAQPVMFNSWVLTYLPVAEVARLQATVDGLALTRGLAWISAETAELSARSITPPAHENLLPGSATLWTLRWAAGGAIHERALAWSHPHGRWARWLASPDLPSARAR